MFGVQLILRRLRAFNAADRFFRLLNASLRNRLAQRAGLDEGA